MTSLPAANPAGPAAAQRDLSERTLGALLLAPAVLLLLVIVVYPIGTLFWNSLHGVHNANPAAGEQSVGSSGRARRSWR